MREKNTIIGDKPLVLAVDPGIANTGYAFRQYDGHIAHGTLTTKTKSPLTERLVQIVQPLSLFYPDVLVIENFFGPLSKETVYLIGAITYGCRAKTTLIVEPAMWVRQMFGLKKAGKYKKEATKLAKKFAETKTQHEEDAISLLRWYETYYLVHNT